MWWWIEGEVEGEEEGEKVEGRGDAVVLLSVHFLILLMFCCSSYSCLYQVLVMVGDKARMKTFGVETPMFSCLVRASCLHIRSFIYFTPLLSLSSGGG